MPPLAALDPCAIGVGAVLVACGGAIEHAKSGERIRGVCAFAAASRGAAGGRRRAEQRATEQRPARPRALSLPRVGDLRGHGGSAAAAAAVQPPNPGGANYYFLTIFDNNYPRPRWPPLCLCLCLSLSLSVYLSLSLSPSLSQETEESEAVKGCAPYMKFSTWDHAKTLFSVKKQIFDIFSSGLKIIAYRE